MCCACGRAYRRAHYLANVPYYTAKAARAREVLRARNYERLIAYLRSHACVDCGESDVRVLQFDHLDRATKRGDISRLLKDHPWKLVLDEIAKCVVRCGNCHRRKTLRELRAHGGQERAVQEGRGVWERHSFIIENWAVSSADRAAAF